MNMSVTVGHQGTLYGTALGEQKTTTNDPLADTATQGASAAADAAGLSDVQLRELATQLIATNAALTALNDELGATPISLPKVASPTDMGALSTADLLQLIRAEVAKTTAMLTAATVEAIKAQQATIQAKGEENKTKNAEADEKRAEAERKAEKMQALNLALKIFGYVAMALMVAMAVVTGGATAVIAVAMLAMFVTMTCMTEIENENGETGMDLMGQKLAKAFYSHLPPEEAERKGAALAGYIMMGIQLAVCIGSLGAAWAGVGSSIGGLVKTASTAAQVGAAAGTAVSQTATAANFLIMAGTRMGQVLQMIQGITSIAKGVVALESADAQYDASMAQAEVTKLKALIKSLETILQSDTEFLQMLMDLQAQLDAAVAGIVRDEDASCKATDLHAQVMG